MSDGTGNGDDQYWPENASGGARPAGRPPTGPPPTQTGPAAGWYQDPDGVGLRWWDGDRWTDHRSPDAQVATAADPVPGRVLASFGQRVGAFLIDLLVVLVVVVVPAFLLLGLVAVLAGSGATPEPVFVVGAVGAYVVFFVAVSVLPISYRAELQWRRHGATVGKALVGIEVVDRRTGGRMTRGRSWGRAAVNTLVSGQVCYLGYLWMLFDAEKRTWHDMIIESHVVVRQGDRPRLGELLRRS